MPAVSVVVPAYNEAKSIKAVVAEIRRHLQAEQIEHEVIVVVDGATDDTAKLAREAADQIVEHSQNFGYGRSLKSGIAAAKHDLIAITDADQTYPVDRIPEMIGLAQRFDMVVGARQGQFYQGSTFKRWGRHVFRWLSEFSAGQNIPDINSGLRVFRRSQIMQFFPIISAGFSFTTTSTLAYLHNDLSVHYIPIKYGRREGRSKVRHVRDSLRALQIIVEAILRCNPVKVFLLLAAPFAILGFWFAIAAVVWQSVWWFLCAIIAGGTAAIVLSLGFLAVAVMPRRRIIEESLDVRVGETAPAGDPADDV